MNSRVIMFARALVVGSAATFALMASTPGFTADPAPGAKPVPTSNKWRVKFDGRADVAGEIALAIILDGVTTVVVTKVPKGKGENAVATLVRDQLKKGAPPKHFHIETDDGEDVLVKKKLGMGTDNFGLELVSSSVTGLGIRIHKE